MDDLQRYNQLIQDIRRHDALYYQKAQPEIGDSDYDALMHELKELEAVHPDWVTQDSPSQVVNGEYQSGIEATTASEQSPAAQRLNRVEHSVPMLSIDNTYSLGELDNWANRTQKLLSEQSSDDQIEWVVELKIDGVSGALIYDNGTLKRMVTRGDGHWGDDYSANAVMLTNIPERIALPGKTELDLRQRVEQGRIEIRGEIYMTNEDLVALNLIREQEGDAPFANTRNLTSGSIGLGYDDRGRDVVSLKPEDVAEKDRSKLAKEQANVRLERTRRKLGFFFHSLGSTDGLPVKTHWDFLKLVESWGFAPTPMAAKFDSFAKVKEYCESVIERLDELNFEIDGLVIKVNSLAQREILGQTAKSPRWVIAYKFQKYEALTKVLDIRLQVGKSGVITPVADVEPCEIAGTTVSRSSLHNFDELRRKDIRIGDIIVMEKAGKIIPHVVRTEKHLRKEELPEFPLPTECPVCHAPAVKDPDTVYLRCVNPDCPAQLKEKIRYFATRGAMDITGLGDKNVDKLVDSGLVRSFADIYRLADRREDMIELFYPTSGGPAVAEDVPEPATFEPAEMVGALEALDFEADDGALTVSVAKSVGKPGAKSASKKKRPSTLMVDNLLAAIERSKRRGLGLLLNGLSIQHVGARVATVLARRFKTAKKLMAASADDLSSVNEIGPIIAQSVWSFFHLPDGAPAHGAQTVTELAEMDVLVDLPGYVPTEERAAQGSLFDFNPEETEELKKSESLADLNSLESLKEPAEVAKTAETAKSNGKLDTKEAPEWPASDAAPELFEGLSIVVTGTLERFKRQDIERLIESLGGRASSSVSKKTAFVVAGAEAGSKKEKALALGVPVITEDEFLEKIPD